LPAIVLILILLGVAVTTLYFALSPNSELGVSISSPVTVADSSAGKTSAGAASDLDRATAATSVAPTTPAPVHNRRGATAVDQRPDGRDSARLSWQDPTHGQAVTETAAEAFAEATKYVLGDRPRQKEALRLYQRVLDSNPTRQLELNVKLTMGARMTVLYDPDLGEDSMYAEAVPWYEQIVEDFNDWGSHRDLMVAKIHLGDLYCMGSYGIADVQKASELCRELIEVAQEQIVFDDPQHAYLNLDNIAKAKGPLTRIVDVNGQLLKEPTEEMNERYRQELLQRRKQFTDRLRRAAIYALANKQHIPGFPLEVKLNRLLQFKQERPDDQLYQETLTAIIEDFKKEYQSHIDAGFNDALEAVEEAFVDESGK
jgi:tetratricopeptide (TPR) repeat protein